MDEETGTFELVLGTDDLRALHGRGTLRDVLEGVRRCKCMHIRRAQAEDAPPIHAVMQAAFGPFEPQYTPDCFDATVLDPDRIVARIQDGAVWVAEDDDGIVGTIGATLDDRGAYVRGLGVHPDAEGRGIGRRLLAVAEGYAGAHGAACIWLSTTTFLQASQALYHRVGYLPAAGPSDLHGTPLVSFEKPLT